jgi:arsenate reductase (thioredoxin)
VPTVAAGSAFLYEGVLTALLMFVIMAVAADTRAVGAGTAIAIGGVIGLDALFGGAVTGASMNPARSFGPALISSEWRDFWMYVAGPILGAGVGAFAYQLSAASTQRPPSPWNRRSNAMAHVLFVCLHNAGRSQMSQALFERTVDGRHTAASAGTTPADRVHPEVIEVMRELDIDLSDRRPQLLTRELAQRADIVVTMGCGDECPFIPGKRYLDWDLPDPKDQPLGQVRGIRDEIASRVEQLIAELDQTTATSTS